MKRHFTTTLIRLDKREAWRYHATHLMRATVLLVAGLLFALVPSLTAESTYCAFEIKVTTKSGAPRAKVPVILVRAPNSTFSETLTDENGVARLCDAPLEAVNIAVGFDVCGLVTVRNLHPLWPETKRVFVTFEDNPCNHFVLSEHCQVLLRVEDQESRPVPGVRFNGSLPKNGSGSDTSDELGRIFRLVKRDEKLEGVVTGDRGRTKAISVLVTDDVELRVVLPK
jgi:hypothetical protein